MTDQEHDIKQQLAIHDAKFMMIMDELKQQREDMRRAREKHDADMRQLQERQDVMQAKHDAEMKDMREKHDADMHEMNERFYGRIDDLSKQINDTWKQTMIGVGGMVIGLGALIIAALK